MEFVEADIHADRRVPMSLQDDPALAARTGNIRLFSATWRLWKLPGLEPACEDYGQAVRYRGSVAHCPDRLVLDKHHVLQSGKLELVCGNTFRMLRESRFGPNFRCFLLLKLQLPDDKGNRPGACARPAGGAFPEPAAAGRHPGFRLSQSMG